MNKQVTQLFQQAKAALKRDNDQLALACLGLIVRLHFGGGCDYALTRTEVAALRKQYLAAFDQRFGRDWDHPDIRRRRIVRAFDALKKVTADDTTKPKAGTWQ